AMTDSPVTFDRRAMVRWSGPGALTSSGLVDRLTAGYGPHNGDVFDLVLIDQMRIIRQDDEIRELAGCNGSFDPLFVVRVCSIDREHPQRLGHADPLIGPPGLAVPTLARHHALHAHQGCEGTGTEIRTGRGRDSSVGK